MNNSKISCWIFGLALVLCALVARSQTVSPFMGLGSAQFFDNNGKPLTAGVLYSFQAGTSLQQATYTDATGGSVNVNPLPFGSGARASIWLTSTLKYKFVLCAQNDGAVCAPGDVLFSMDQVPGNLNGLTTNASPFTGVFISSSASPATAGVLRLASGDSVCWMNTATSGNLCFSKDISDVLNWSGGVIKMPEISCFNSSVGFDYLCADSATHHWKISNNAGSQMLISGLAAAGVAGHTVSLATNGIDTQDSGGTAPAVSVVSFTSSPTFVATSQDQLFQMTLAGNVTVSSLVATGLPVPSLLTFELTQDATGGRTFSWPGNFLNAQAPNTQPNFITVEQFLWDGTAASLVGNVKCTVITKSANYTATTADCIIQASASGGSVTLTLPQLSTGQSWVVTRTDTSANTLTIQGSGGTVNGTTNIKLGKNMTTVCHSDGTNLWCTNPGAEYLQSTTLTGSAAVFTYPVPYSTTPNCFCTGYGGSCNVSSVTTTACTLSTLTVPTNAVMVTGIP